MTYITFRYSSHFLSCVSFCTNWAITWTSYVKGDILPKIFKKSILYVWKIQILDFMSILHFSVSLSFLPASSAASIKCCMCAYYTEWWRGRNDHNTESALWSKSLLGEKPIIRISIIIHPFTEIWTHAMIASR